MSRGYFPEETEESHDSMMLSSSRSCGCVGEKEGKGVVEVELVLLFVIRVVLSGVGGGDNPKRIVDVQGGQRR